MCCPARVVRITVGPENHEPFTGDCWNSAMPACHSASRVPLLSRLPTRAKYWSESCSPPPKFRTTSPAAPITRTAAIQRRSGRRPRRVRNTVASVASTTIAAVPDGYARKMNSPRRMISAARNLQRRASVAAIPIIRYRSVAFLYCR